MNAGSRDPNQPRANGDMPADISAYGPSNAAFGIICDGFVGGELRFSFYCKECGGWVLTTDDDVVTDESVMRCKACGRLFGLLRSIRASALIAARVAGISCPEGGDPRWYPP